MLQNPNKYIRKAFLLALANVGVQGWDKRIPANETIPQTYYLISNQTKTEIQRTKCDKAWQVVTTIDIFHRENRGFSDSAIVDDLEELITDALAPDVQTDLAIPPFIVYNTFVESPVDLPQETINETVLHRALRIRITLG
jgi:hypothetical protein